MHLSRRAGLAGIAALALLTAPALGQTSTGSGSSSGSTQTTTSDGSAAKPAIPAGAPTPQEPAATETPSQPAAAGGDASDATSSGQPAGSSVTSPASGSTDTGSSGTSGSSSSGKDGTAQLPEPNNMGASPTEPRNAVGDKFELPQVGKGNQVEMIAGLCGVQLKGMTTAACTCLAEKALTALSDPQRDYLIASVVAPPVSDRMLKDGRVGEADQKLLFAFLNKTSTECAASTAGTAPAGGASSGGAISGEATPDIATPQTPGGDGGGMSNKDGIDPKMDTPPTAKPKPSN